MNNFPETADIETSSDEYAGRFAGPVGSWMLDVQEKISVQFIHDSAPESILDVGGGHGQLAIPLVQKKYSVSVLSSSDECKNRISKIVESGQCQFHVGNVIDLPFDDQSFDMVICFRLLTHCERWPELIQELCRVSRKGIILDYPTSQSLNKIAPMLFKAKKKIEKNTRTWKLFIHDEVINEFEKNGFRVENKKAQFFWPMVLHRALRCRGVSVFLEFIIRIFGLTKLWGSPVIIKFIRE